MRFELQIGGKSENTIINIDFYCRIIKILDFGISKSQTFTRLTQSGMLLGTLRYLSPEQVSFSELTVASDVFSLGIIFYEMLSGETPFSGDTTMEVVKHILGKKPKALNKSTVFVLIIGRFHRDACHRGFLLFL